MPFNLTTQTFPLSDPQMKISMNQQLKLTVGITTHGNFPHTKFTQNWILWYYTQITQANILPLIKYSKLVSFCQVDKQVDKIQHSKQKLRMIVKKY